MEDLLMNVIANLPNFAVALVMLWWQRQTIEGLMENQNKLIDRLLSYVDKDKLQAASERKSTQELLAVKAASETSKP